MPAEDLDDLSDLRRKVAEGISRLRGLDIGDELGVEILSRLVHGRRTVSEIVEQAYGLRSTDEGFYASYRRVSREIRRLESKGLVSRRLFGRDKPYRLTELAIINLAKIGGEAKQIRALAPSDVAIYLATLGVSLPVAFIAVDWIKFSEPIIVGMFGCFCFLLGLSFGRFIQNLRRVL